MDHADEEDSYLEKVSNLFNLKNDCGIKKDRKERSKSPEKKRGRGRPRKVRAVSVDDAQDERSVREETKTNDVKNRNRS